jgi:hypothetical protein
MLDETDGLHRHYFDSRGAHRIYELRITDDAWRSRAKRPGMTHRRSRSGFTVTFENGDDTMEGRSAISYDGKTWQDNLQVTYRRSQ